MLTKNGYTFFMWYWESASLVTGKQAGIARGSESMNFCGSRKIQTLSELVLQFFALSFCSSDKEKRKTRRYCSPVVQRNTCLPAHRAWASGL
jgi:hypothetical protein